MTVPSSAAASREGLALARADVLPSSIPRNTEEGRALLQARLAQFGRIGTAIGFTFAADGARASTLPMATLAVDLRARQLSTPAAWHSSAGATREPGQWSLCSAQHQLPVIGNTTPRVSAWRVG